MPASAAPSGPAHLLVVDDNEMNRDMLSRRLGARGYRVSVAEDGNAALRLIAQQRFDAVLLDVMMPVVTGLDVLEQVRAGHSESDLPVIMATARDASEDVVAALRLGANDYVTKPLDFAVVLARLETQLALKRQKDEIRRLAQDLEVRNRFIQATFGRYLSDEVVESLLSSPEGLKLGGEQRKVTILMSDLRGFTAACEDLGPEQVVRLLNSYLGAMAEVILRYQGTIDEFVGDAILAIFGAPLSRPDDATRAIACAVAMQREVEALNDRNARVGLPALEMGVGIHTGEVVVGNLGSERRAKYGIVGSPVNHTGRIESFSVGGQVLVSEDALAEAGTDVRVGQRLVVEAKGAREPLVVYDLRGIAGEHGLFLPEVEDEPVALAEPAAFRFRFVDGKRVGDREFEASFVALSDRGGLVRCLRRLRPLSNIRIELADVDSADLYAKVLDARGDGLYAVRFTAVPPSAEAWRRRVLGR